MELNPSYLFDFSKEVPPFLTSQESLHKICRKRPLDLKKPSKKQASRTSSTISHPHKYNLYWAYREIYQELIMVTLFLHFSAVRWFLFVLWSMHQCLWSWMGSTTHYLQVERCEALSSLHCIIPLDSLDMLSTIHLTFTKMCH